MSTHLILSYILTCLRSCCLILYISSLIVIKALVHIVVISSHLIVCYTILSFLIYGLALFHLITIYLIIYDLYPIACSPVVFYRNTFLRISSYIISCPSIQPGFIRSDLILSYTVLSSLAIWYRILYHHIF